MPSTGREELAKLAALGGAPAFDHAYYVGRPNIGNRSRLMERFNDILDRRWFTNSGSYEQDLERRLAERFGVRNCVAMCNGTVGLEIAIRALGLTGEVIVPSLTFVATAHALQWQGITPVFADVDPKSYTLDSRQVEQMITPRTTGIIGVHAFGRMCDVDALSQVAESHHLKLLFDAAHAIGCTYKGKFAGSFGEAEMLSFHATKIFNTFEGGAILTDNDALAKQMRLMRNFGFSGYDEVIYIGTNGKMNEFSAAMGITSLDALDEFIADNKRNYEAYLRGLDGVAGITVMRYDESERNNYQYVVLDIDSGLAGVTRDDIQRVLWAENIFARRYFYPGCHRMEPYKSHYPHAGLLLPVTERLNLRLLQLPTGPTVSVGDIDVICDILKLVVGNGTEISQRLRGVS